MRKLLILIFIVLSSCNDGNLEYIGQDIIDGKVSAIAEGHPGRGAIYPKIWVQDSTSTQEVDIPFKYEGRWKVGDSCLLIIEKYKEITKEQ